MLAIINIIKYIVIGIVVGMTVFVLLGSRHYYSEELSNPIESKMYIEVLNLYKKDIIEKVSWTSASQRFFSPDTMTAYITTNLNQPERFKLFSEYKPMDAPYPMYLIQSGNQHFSLKFRTFLEIRVWQ